MVRLVDDDTYFAKSDHMETFFGNKESDCVLYSEEGNEFNIHKEVLGQTDFLRKILSSSKDDCCKTMYVFCPCPKLELDHMVHFLYTGTISCESEIELMKIQENLNKILGFSEKMFLSDDYKVPIAEAESEKNSEKIPDYLRKGMNNDYKQTDHLKITDDPLMQDGNEDFSIQYANIFTKKLPTQKVVTVLM